MIEAEYGPNISIHRGMYATTIIFVVSKHGK